MSKIFDALRKVQAEISGDETSRKADADSPAPVSGSNASETGKAAGPGSPFEVPQAFAAEIVSMRYSLESKVSRAHKALAFTCSVSGEGVSMVSRMFSQILVQDPMSKVVLVDANTHNPNVNSSFDVPAGPGLTDLLAGRRALGECLHATVYPRLSVMPAGESMVSPMQAFATEQMKKMISDILAGHDYLVFDTPPVLPYPEATILSSKVDGVVFVVQAIRTKKEVVKKAVDGVGKGGGEVLGLVLNKNKHFIPEFIYKRV